ncbi:alpha-carbonic anhydrases signature [Trichococcus flocculiformis]|jgi:carbonic anhydrase|uniref:Carbonic anhydrase n=2 Tax=Trichococcus TaxID=82802 RepID=A0AB38BJB3_9LACT|nr:carbonic anhydrase family protein [Trichococcus flocculiformis]CZQ91697.1 alpha-carbonic anhydrases signature [Trichococcus flocculiformis]SFH95198.1 carbonic anhydrase [Trichococcus flocculiformis]HRF51200.1 carbonic anhydrase family protein [Trichococcus flocculiformis]
MNNAKGLTKVLAVLGAFVLLGLSGCGQEETVETDSSAQETTELTSETTTEETTEAAAEEHLDYENQDEWDFESGAMQSPINIETSATEAMTTDGSLTLDYAEEIIDVVDNGHSIEIEDGGQATIAGRGFELAQFHLHSPSEHTVDGESFPIELHFVHKAQDGRLAVIAVFFKEGTENAAFQAILDDVQANEESDVASGLSLNVAELLPANKSYYHYLGSLTTPPLTENVEWYVMANPVEVSAEQIAAFNEYYEGNNREVQPLGERSVLKYEE